MANSTVPMRISTILIFSVIIKSPPLLRGLDRPGSLPRAFPFEALVLHPETRPIRLRRKLYFSAEWYDQLYRPHLEAGFSKAGASKGSQAFDFSPYVTCVMGND